MITIKADYEIVLKSLSADSTELIFDAVEKNREFLRIWLPFVDYTRSAEDTRIFIESVIESRIPKKDLVFEIWYNEEFAGLVSLKEVDNINRKTELGYWLTKNMQGKGIMIRSCRAMITYAFEKLKMNRVQIKVAVENKQSIQIPVRLGFLYEGIEREGESLNKRFTDLKVYSILKKEWKTIKE